MLASAQSLLVATALLKVKGSPLGLTGGNGVQMLAGVIMELLAELDNLLAGSVDRLLSRRVKARRSHPQIKERAGLRRSDNLQGTGPILRLSQTVGKLEGVLKNFAAVAGLKLLDRQCPAAGHAEINGAAQVRQPGCARQKPAERGMGGNRDRGGGMVGQGVQGRQGGVPTAGLGIKARHSQIGLGSLDSQAGGLDNLARCGELGTKLAAGAGRQRAAKIDRDNRMGQIDHRGPEGR